MNLKYLSDDKLDQEMVRSVKDETQSTLRVLHHLREVDRRRLYSKYKFRSLLEYAEKRLAYPYDQAWRRIQAMRLLKEMPEIENKIADGTLNLTNIGYAQAAFKAEAKKETPLCKEEKLQFLSQIENQSTRAAQKLVAEKFGQETLIRETVKPVTPSISMLNVPVKDGFLAKIDKLKGLLAHSHAGISTAKLLEYVVDAVLEQALAKKVAASRKSVAADFKESKSQSTVSSVLKETAEDSLMSAPNRGLEEKTPSQGESKSTARYIPARESRAVWRRDKAQCSNCGSTYGLELDHKIPFAKKGQSSRENLRLLCRSCNQRAAIESFGWEKMSSYLRAPARSYSALPV